MKWLRHLSFSVLLMTFLSGIAFAAVGNNGVEDPLTDIGHHVLTKGPSPMPRGQGPCAILYAPSQPDDPALRAAIAAITGSTVDYFDARAATPTLSQLTPYCCVYTWANYAYADNVAFGDVLADFVDQGGAVVLGAWCVPSAGNYLSGRIMTSGYCPVTGNTSTSTSSTYAGDGTSVIYDGVTTFSASYHDILTLQGSGIQDGTYLDGTIAHAYRPDFAVIYSNGIASTVLGSTGDWPLLIANACEALDEPAPAPMPIPALNEWGMILFALIIAGFAVIIMKRNRSIA
jgi:hypothetical protein